MTKEDVETIYQILVEECGANPNDFDQFSFHWPECREYRFIGNQGFGGKIFADMWFDGKYGPYVTCYTEDDNEVRRQARERANARLRAWAS